MTGRGHEYARAAPPTPVLAAPPFACTRAIGGDSLEGLLAPRPTTPHASFEDPTLHPTPKHRLVGEVGIVSPEEQRKELFGERWDSSSARAAPQEAAQRRPGGTGGSTAADQRARAKAVERRKEQ